MPGPTTEVLNADLKDVKDDLRRVETSIREDLTKLAVGYGELRTEVRDAIGLAKWVGTIVVASVLTSGVGAVIWGASLTAKVSGLETRTVEKFQETNTRIDKLEASINRRIDVVDSSINARIDKLEASVNARFDKLEATIAKALETVKTNSKGN